MPNSESNSIVRSRSRLWMFVAAIVFAGASVVGGRCRAAIPEKDDRPKRLEDGFPDVLTFISDTRHSNAIAIPDMPRLNEQVQFQVRTADDHVSKYVADLLITEERKSIAGDSSETQLDFGLGYSGLTVGKVFPLLGYVYEVVEIVNGDRRVLTLNRINDKARLKEIGIRSDSIALPLHARCGVGGFRQEEPQFSHIEVEQIAVAGNAKEKLKARLAVNNVIEPSQRHFVESAENTKHLDVAVGDTVELIDGYRLKVRSIVPHDDHGVVGWVEFGLSRVEPKK